MYNFLTKTYIPVGESKLKRRCNYRLIYSEKLDRYKYWLNVNGKIPENIEVIKK